MRAIIFCAILGAGCGLTTIALHRRNFSVVSTDKKSLLDVLQRNISDYTAQLIDGESHSRNIVVLEFEWEKVSSPKKLDQMIPQSMLDVDLIVCSDCLYDSTSVEPLLRTLEMVSLIHVAQPYSFDHDTMYYLFINMHSYQQSVAMYC